MVLPSLLLVLAVALGAVAAAAAQLSCADAARVGARALARGESPEYARSLALSAAPGDAHVQLSESEGMARVTVHAAVRIGPLRAPPLRVDGSAAVPLEPGLVEQPGQVAPGPSPPEPLEPGPLAPGPVESGPPEPLPIEPGP